MKNYTLFKFGETKIQFNEKDTNEIKIVDFVCEVLRDEAYAKLTTQIIVAKTWNPLTDPWD